MATDWPSIWWVLVILVGWIVAQQRVIARRRNVHAPAGDHAVDFIVTPSFDLYPGDFR